ncbi:MAG: hypothetical protein A2Y07_10920 [Planctomycetes bacterium GWF2_50_10]|nr:MAG: hypothetical protein A2Y07_10920 [Planctomycetes bacterium GWF2_50_10]
MSKLEGQNEAIKRAKADLAKIDVAARCVSLALGSPAGGLVPFRAFGSDCLLKLDSLDLTLAASGNEMKPGDQILVLHYLLCDVPVQPTGEMITFRDMPGGQFYWQPFLSRSVDPLLKRVGNDLETLKTNLKRFDFELAQDGDLSANIHALGKIYARLVYHLGDEEFPPAAEILFDSSIRRIYNSEDVAFLASRICLGLL